MIIEHLVYTSALAIVAGMVFLRWTGRDPSWIAIAASFAPDIDMILNHVLKVFGFRILYHGRAIMHGDFHTLMMLALFAIMAAFLLHPIGVRFFDAALFAGLGFLAHLAEDALVYAESYRFLWPLSNQQLGLQWMDYHRDLWGIADTQVLALGLALLIVATLIRTWFDGSCWIRENIGVRLIQTALFSSAEYPPRT